METDLPPALGLGGQISSVILSATAPMLHQDTGDRGDRKQKTQYSNDIGCRIRDKGYRSQYSLQDTGWWIRNTLNRMQISISRVYSNV
jgi:hypothetical protein